MEFFKTKHYTFSIIFFVIFSIQNGFSLEGVPSWICLGIKSPFIEFKSEIEILSNISVSLNVTDADADNVIKYGKGSEPFIYSIGDRHNNISNTKNPSAVAQKINRLVYADENDMSTVNPIIADMNSKKEVTLIELKENESDLNSKNNDRKYIIPLALKTPTIEPKKIPIFQTQSSTNIEDLKKHILMLQNLTKIDQSFQSKFVVFPNQKSTAMPASSAIIRQTTTKSPYPAVTLKTFLTKARIISTISPSSASNSQPQRMQQLKRQQQSPTRTPLSLNMPKDNLAKDILRNSNEDYHSSEKITIIPQVFLQNDQMPMNDDSFETQQNVDKKDSRLSSYSRKGYVGQHFFTDVTSAKSPPQQQQQQRQTNNNNMYTTTMRSTSGRRKQKNRKQNNGFRRNCNNLKKQYGRRRLKNGDAIINAKLANCTKAGRVALNKNRSSNFSQTTASSRNDTKLSRNPRSEYQQQQQQQQQHQRPNGTKNLSFPSSSNNILNAINQTNNIYKENIDLNPNLCHNVLGLSYGQQKLCVLNTNVMPAISRGARAAIQECKHQFKNRRWNCSTNEDSSVFGPITNIGSPEMAFVHALTAAGAASFIARACRDGQLATCGCSRSSRPQQLHADWTWGGCGDDLEFGYKFSQSFIDVREKELRRGIRGVVTVPEKLPKLNENSLLTTDATNDTMSNDTVINANINVDQQKDLIELKEKIEQEIFNSKLEEKTMHELQEKINREILNSKVFNLEHQGLYGKKIHQRIGGGSSSHRIKTGGSAKARSLMNLHNNEAGRRAVIKNSKITCKCHGISGSCSLITCWQQLTSMREIGDFLREKYDEATQVKINKRGRLQVKDPRYKVPTALDLVYLDDSPDWCRINRQLQWAGIHNRICNKTSTGLDGCGILCCGRGYNTKKIVVRDRCNCIFRWCCEVKCSICTKYIEEYSCK